MHRVGIRIVRGCCLAALIAAMAGCAREATPIPAASAPTAPPPGPTPATATQARPTATSAPTATAQPPTATPQPLAAAWSYPIGLPGQPAGDGFFIRHGYNVENTWYNPGYWHTGEDWYALDGAETAGAAVYAVAAGEVVYLGGNYPGRVVIVQHADLFSLYGHLDPAVPVGVGDRVERGALLGAVLKRSDTVPSHLHFEIRAFLTAAEVNGETPRFAFRCGVNCPPGPGYWPMEDSAGASAMGWRNPTHVIASRAFAALAPGGQAEVIVASRPGAATTPIWPAIPQSGADQPAGELNLEPGRRWTLLEVATAPEASGDTGAASYAVWYRIALDDGTAGWVAACVASPAETGSDGRASSVQFNFLPNDRIPQ